MKKCILQLAICLMVLSSFAACKKAPVQLTPDELLNLGEKYLIELNYEQALVQFLKVIEIEPMNPRGYTGAAEAYVGLDRAGEAIAILEKGYERTKNDSIKAALDLLKQEDTIETEDAPTIEPAQPEGGVESDLSDEPVSGNLTGKGPFTLSDLEEWGFPWGMSAKELYEKGWIDAPTYEIAQELYGQNSNNGTHSDRTVIVDHENLQIGSVSVFGEDTAKGPRDLAIGMGLEEVIHLFQCDNSAVLEFAKNSSNIDLLTPIDDDSEANYSYSDKIYGTAAEYDGEEYPCNAGIRTKENGDSWIYYLANFRSPHPTQLGIDIKNGVVSSFHISYYY